MTLDIDALYAAFNNRDIDSATAAMHPDVEWPNGWEGGWLRGRDAVRAYWIRQWQEIDPHVAPTAIKPTDDGRTAVTVHLTGRDADGNEIYDTHVTHVYTTDADGLVTRMDVY